MDQAKWYYIRFSDLLKFINVGNHEYPSYKVDNEGLKRRQFYYLVLINLMKEDISLKRIKRESIWIDFFCGKKKLNKIIEEAHLLGLEDELLIFERRNKR